MRTQTRCRLTAAACLLVLTACSLDAMNQKPPGEARATTEAQQVRLAGTSWVITRIDNGTTAVTSLLADTQLTLEFGADGRASGSSGCNRYTAQYTEGGAGAMSVERAAGTRKMCMQPGIMEQERQFLDALASVASARLEGDRLELRRADGALVLEAMRTVAH